MAERRSSWPWRKKSSNNTTKPSFTTSTPLPFNSLPSLSQLTSPVSSFKGEDESLSFPDISFNMHENHKTDKNDAGARLVEEMHLRQQAEEKITSLEEKVTSLEEKLSIALAQMSAKEASISHHQKALEEANSGRENAEKEALLFKHELDATSQQKSILEDRVAQLDGAFKECTRQVRVVKEEQEKKIQEAISSTTREWEKIKSEVDAKQSELERRLMESEAQNSAMAKSLQDRAKKIVEANEAKTKAETEVELLQVKLSSYEKEISSLKYELHVLSKELDIRNEEVDFIKKSADAAHKQHLDNVKKMANLEADCTRLRNLVRKKLPGAAAIAQMRKEVDILPGSRDYNTSGDVKRKPKLGSPTSVSGSYSTNNRDVEMLRERMFSMEEETKLLKEALSKRNEELQASRLLCAKTASKLYLGDDTLDSPQGTPRALIKTNGFMPITPTKEPSVASASDDVEESSCAESWASALISELAHFKKGKNAVGSSDFASDAVNPGSVAVPISISRLDMILSKIISLLEVWPHPVISIEETKDCIDGDASKKEESPSKSRPDQLKEALVSSKDKFLVGKSSIFEYLLRLAAVLCEACNTDACELEDLLSKLNATSTNDGSSLTEVSSTGYLSELSLLREQLQTLGERKAELEQQLATSCRDLESMTLELDKSKQLVADIQAKVAELESVKKKLCDEEVMKTEIQKKLEASQVEISKLQASIASLTLELADQKALHDRVVTKYKELEHKLEGLGYDDHNDERNGYNLPEGECMKTKKEQELLAAKTKLAECQRTILALGKQLSTLSTSPPVDHSSSMGSFDGTGSSSMDSASQQLDRRSMHADNMNTQSMGFMEEEEDEEGEEDDNHHHHHDRIHNGGMYYNGVGGVMAPQNHHHIYQHRAGSGYIQTERQQLYDEDQMVLQRGWYNGCANTSNKGMMMNMNHYSNGQVDMYQSNNNRVVVHRRGSLPLEGYDNSNAQYINNHNNTTTDGGSYCEEESFMVEGTSELHHTQSQSQSQSHPHAHAHAHNRRQQLNVGCYNNPTSGNNVGGSHYMNNNRSRSGSPTMLTRGHNNNMMMMSPARSPGRFTQQQKDASLRGAPLQSAVAQTRQNSGQVGGFRMSLAETMNTMAMVPAQSGEGAAAVTPRAAKQGTGGANSGSGSSAFGRLFSRSKNHNRGGLGVMTPETEHN